MKNSSSVLRGGFHPRCQCISGQYRDVNLDLTDVVDSYSTQIAWKVRLALQK